MPKGTKGKRGGKAPAKIIEAQVPEHEQDDEEEGSEINASQVGSKTKLWTESKESYLIQLWQEEKHLYDVEDPNYRDGDMRTRALKRFAAALDLDGELTLKFT